MHHTLEERFVNAFPEMIKQLKIDCCLVPVMELFLNQLEKHGFSLAEILIALSFVLEDRSFKEAASLIEAAAKHVDLAQEQLFEDNK